MQFGARKMGEDEISNQVYHQFRESLERELDGLQAMLKQVNESNKPPPPPPQPIPEIRLDPIGKVIRETDRIVGQVTAPGKRLEKNIRRETKNIGKRIRKIFG